jgi:uncharacterized membrane-anchored protein YjiN (DUF445 family)
MTVAAVYRARVPLETVNVLVESAPPVPADEAERRVGLRRMKTVATALLVGAAVVYVITRSLEDTYSWLSPVRATAEAALVGGLADWFAVTALFRHPLGVPIPHTAIIPANKDRIGRTLGRFVQENFLSTPLVAQRLRDAHPARRAAAWLARPANAERASATVGGLVSSLPDVFNDEEVASAVHDAIIDRVRATPAAPILARGLEMAIAEGHHHALVDAVLLRAGDYLDDHRDLLRERLRRESPWWLPETLDDRIFAKVFSGAKRLVTDLAEDPEHPLRRDIDSQLIQLVGRLRSDPELAAAVEARKSQLLDHPDVQAWAGSVWSDVKDYLLRSAGDPSSPLRGRFAQALVTVGSRLRDDESLQATVDGWLIEAATGAVELYGENVAEYIAATMARWDPAETSDRLELVVGRDLQFIRLNGTIVGGLAGLIIYVIGNLL